MKGILAGIKVVDFGRYVAGPYAATLLGYLGADVIRVERPGGGEDRFIAPVAPDGHGAVFFQTAGNKRSLTLNLRAPESRGIIDRLIEQADVLVANLPPAALEKLGLAADRVAGLNPRAILSTQTAFGSSGPWSERGGFDGVGQAMSGAAFMTGEPGAPAKAAAPYVDYSTAVLSAFGIVAALYERQRSGHGRHVEASLLGTALSVFGSHLVEEGVRGIGRVPTGNRVQTSGPSDVFRTRDGHVLMHVVGGGLFRRVAQLIGREEWIGDERFATDALRGDHRDELCTAVASWCLEQTTDGALESLATAGIPAGPVLDLAGALNHPQTAAVELFSAVAWPGVTAPVAVPGLPLAFDLPQPGLHQPPPAIGEHTDEILGELGFARGEVDAYRSRGVV
ncbi:MAG: CoA transferase [Pseudomonadota bacterium]